MVEFVANCEATELHCDEGTSWAPAAALAADWAAAAAAMELYPTVVPVALLPTVLPAAAAAVNHAVVGHVVSGKRYPDNVWYNFYYTLEHVCSCCCYKYTKEMRRNVNENFRVKYVFDLWILYAFNLWNEYFLPFYIFHATHD